jgi:hypothetical protein
MFFEPPMDVAMNGGRCCQGPRTDVILGGSIPFPEMKPRQGVVQKPDSMRDYREPNDRLQEVPRHDAERSSGFACSSATNQRLW